MVDQGKQQIEALLRQPKVLQVAVWLPQSHLLHEIGKLAKLLTPAENFCA